VSKRSRIVGFGSAGLLVLAGIACAFAFSGGLGQNLAFGLVALGLIEGTALVFYEVGLTEDKDRARERRVRAPRTDPGFRMGDDGGDGRAGDHGHPGDDVHSGDDGHSGDDDHPGDEGLPAERPKAGGPRGADHPGRLSRPRAGLDRMRGRPRRLR
jgi:hypothetical protein